MFFQKEECHTLLTLMLVFYVFITQVSNRSQRSHQEAATTNETSTPMSLSARFQNARMSQPDTAYDSRLTSCTGITRGALNPGRRLTDQLLEQGLLTPAMLERLQRELTGGATSNNGFQTNNGSPRKGRKKRK